MSVFDSYTIRSKRRAANWVRWRGCFVRRAWYTGALASEHTERVWEADAVTFEGCGLLAF